MGLGARLLAVVGGGTACTGEAPRIGWGEVRTAPGAPDDPLFAGLPERLRVLHRHDDRVDPPAGATLLASCDSHPAQAFRIGAHCLGAALPPATCRPVIPGGRITAVTEPPGHTLLSPALAPRCGVRPARR
nr:hypothetical protein [Streptomyces sp. ADI93-02]